MIKSKIGENAGIIWSVLDNNREMNIKELKKATKINEKDIHLALGWLSKENKLFFWGDEKDYNFCLTEN
jgi:hypothetical protein